MECSLFSLARSAPHLLKRVLASASGLPAVNDTRKKHTLPYVMSFVEGPDRSAEVQEPWQDVLWSAWAEASREHRSLAKASRSFADLQVCQTLWEGKGWDGKEPKNHTLVKNSG